MNLDIRRAERPNFNLSEKPQHEPSTELDTYLRFQDEKQRSFLVHLVLLGNRRKQNLSGQKS